MMRLLFISLLFSSASFGQYHIRMIAADPTGLSDTLYIKEGSPDSLWRIINSTPVFASKSRTVYSFPFFQIKGLPTTLSGYGIQDAVSNARVNDSLLNLRTALNSKQATLVSATNIKTINGASVLGSGDLVVSGGGLGYTLSVQALTSSPADGQTIYFGQLPKAPTTSANISKVYIRKAGTIKMANIYCYSGTAGTAEAWVMSIRLNNTTDTQIASVAAATNERIFSNSSLNIVVAAGDYIEIKCVNPTWATNPLTTIFGGYIYIE